MKSANNYVKVASHEAKTGEFSRCLLLYSGGLDTSVMLQWIQETYKSEVVALTINIGQTADDLVAIQEKARKLGAVDAIVYDAQEDFANNVLSEAIKANADYQGGYALSTPLGRVLISEIAVQVAQKLNCQVIAHGCTGKGNDQVRFESYITTLDPALKIIAPVREWGMGRQEEIAYAKQHNIPVKQVASKPYSYDENMWGNTAEGGEIEDPTMDLPFASILQWCTPIENTPDKPTVINLDFTEGVPTGFNGKKMPLHEIVQLCNKHGATNGIGIVPLIEDRLVGLKVRGVYENPGATILTSAHKKLEQLVSTREENELKTQLDTKWAYLAYAAKWYEPVMGHIRAYMNSQNKKVSGTVTVRLYKGNATVTSLSSPYSLFDQNLATFEKNASFNQNASAGFIEIYNLAQKTAHSVAKKNK